MIVRIPNNWSPREYQGDAWAVLERGCKRVLLVWHRRAGKDDLCLHWSARSLMQRVGTYWHMLPEASQARKAIWEAVNPHSGLRRIDEAFPHEIRESTRENEMFIRFVNGSTWQVVGSDNYNSLVGSPPVGVVCSEWALAKPASWAYLRPILKENGGWCLFVTSSRGKNHAYTMLQGAKDDPNWFTQVLPATQTSVFTAEQLADEKKEYKREHGNAVGKALYEQEYLCSFDGAIPGAIYAEEMSLCREQGRICRVGYVRELPVYTFWDLGIGDLTTIWFAQFVRNEIHLIDYYENTNKDAAHYVGVLNSKPYMYAEDWLPWDGRIRDKASLVSYETMLTTLGRGNVRITPNIEVEAGIAQVRLMLHRCWFDEDKCLAGIEGLINYRRDFNKTLNEVSSSVVHDWASHSSDAFRYLAVSQSQLQHTKNDFFKRKIVYDHRGIV